MRFPFHSCRATVERWTGERRRIAEILTLQVTPRGDEAIKPAELIQVRGHEPLTLNARRMITLLWHNAHLLGVKEGRRYTVEIDALKPAGHKGYEMVEEG